MTAARCLLILLVIVLNSPGARAADESEFKAAYAAADIAAKEAQSLRNQWTTTVSVLALAKQAAERGDYDQAVASAREAEALAKASIFQAQSEKDGWKAMEIR
jgi:hypothetical protein